MRKFVLLPLLLLLGMAGAQTGRTTTSRANLSPRGQRFQSKLDYLNANAEASPPRSRPTQIEASEVNAWFADGGYPLPKGVEKVVFHSQPDTIVANATVDFDAMKEGRRNLNPLLSMFSGVHDVQVTAAATASDGTGHVDVQTVSIDGVEVPRMALQMFVNRYLKPKYPNVDLQNQFRMPDRIDSATVGKDNALLTQK